MLSIWATQTIFNGKRNQDTSTRLASVPVVSSLTQTTWCWGLALTYCVSELQEPPLLELIPKTIIWSCDLSKIDFWSQDKYTNVVQSGKPIPKYKFHHMPWRCLGEEEV
jgi:hypothetical protein